MVYNLNQQGLVKEVLNYLVTGLVGGAIVSFGTCVLVERSPERLPAAVLYGAAGGATAAIFISTAVFYDRKSLMSRSLPIDDLYQSIVEQPETGVTQPQVLQNQAQQVFQAQIQQAFQPPQQPAIAHPTPTLNGVVPEFSAPIAESQTFQDLWDDAEFPSVYQPPSQ